MYADDLLVMCRANKKEAIAVRDCLDNFAAWSRQEVNVSKSSILFTGSTKASKKRNIKKIMGYPEMKRNAIYLGNSFVYSQNKTKEFMVMKQNISKRLKGWSSQTLSKAEKVVLIKNVTQAIPVYTMSTFKVPVGVCNAMDSMVRSF